MANKYIISDEREPPPDPGGSGRAHFLYPM